MIDFIVEQNSYEKMSGFLMLLDKVRIKVVVIFSLNLTISVKKEDLDIFCELPLLLRFVRSTIAGRYRYFR